MRSKLMQKFRSNKETLASTSREHVISELVAKMRAIRKPSAVSGCRPSYVMLCYRMHYSTCGESGNLRQYTTVRGIF